MPVIKPQQALQLGLNVLIDEGCGGENCHLHEFPYKVKNILLGAGKGKVEFNNINDVWEYITLLQVETKKHRKKGGTFTDLNNIFEQLPFFVCRNKIIDEKAQKDIARYVYTKDTGTPPYSGSYGDTPHIWLQKYYIIKQAMMFRDRKLKEKANNGNK
tara:strand:- start:167 stop:640 length:474 start_codon:yes stop_codon:yes gene_type:complete